MNQIYRRHPQSGTLKLRSLYVLLMLIVIHSPIASAADVFNGRSIYRTYCENCHGINGQGKMAGVPNFTRGQTLMHSDLSIFDSIRSGKSTMPGFLGVLSEQEILDVIAYIRTMY